MDNIDPNKLLDMAKGIDQDFNETVELTQFFTEPVNTQKEFMRRRRRLRKNMFKIRKKIKLDCVDQLTAEEEVVKKLVENQLDGNRGITWDTFTFTWDITPNLKSPGRVIKKESWFQEGGQVDQDIGSYFPPAFTEQGF